MKEHQIVIIGGGTAGITVAAQLLKKDKSLDIAIIEPSEKHYYQPAWTLVGAGTFDMKKTERTEASVMPDEVKWIKEYASSIEPDENKVSLKNGVDVKYEYLIVAPGLSIDLDGVEGLREAMGKDGVCSNYIDPEYTWEVLQNFKGGNALFTQPTTPIKCGGAPQKIMYLAAEYFQKHGLADKTNTIFATPGSVIFGVKEFAKTLMKVVNRHNIAVKYFHKLYKIDPKEKKAYYKLTATDDSQCTSINDDDNRVGEEVIGDATMVIKYDMLHLAPPQKSPDFVAKSKIAVQEGGNKGWAEVDHHTLQNPNYPNVFALGDVAALPTAKTGAAVRKQAPVVTENILHMIKNEKKLSDAYQGYSSCPLVTGYGKMVLAEFGYGNKRMSDPLISKFVDVTKENYSMWILKKYGLPYLYWNLMLKGKA
jgi:sulfide:quinone oxidoreductase